MAQTEKWNNTISWYLNNRPDFYSYPLFEGEWAELSFVGPEAVRFNKTSMV